MAARGVAGVAWLGLAGLNVAGANQAQTKAKDQKTPSVWATESMYYAAGYGCKAVALWRRAAQHITPWGVG